MAGAHALSGGGGDQRGDAGAEDVVHVQQHEIVVQVGTGRLQRQDVALPELSVLDDGQGQGADRRLALLAPAHLGRRGHREKGDSLNGNPGFLWTILSFLLVIGPLIFVHELGHYLVGRWCGVKAETFSIGFGREIAGWTDRRGTRWKVGWLPLGGYVKFEGDANAASLPKASSLDKRKQPPGNFYGKNVAQRASVVAGVARRTRNVGVTSRPTRCSATSPAAVQPSKRDGPSASAHRIAAPNGSRMTYLSLPSCLLTR